MLRLAKLLVAGFKGRMITDNTDASGKLQDSFKYNVSGSGIISMDILAAKYAKVIDEGRKPGKRSPSVSSIVDWMKAKNITPYYGTKLKDYKKAAAAIADGIAKNGTIQRFAYKGTNFIKEVAKQYQTEGIIEILEAYKLDIENEINKAIKT